MKEDIQINIIIMRVISTITTTTIDEVELEEGI